MLIMVPSCHKQEGTGSVRFVSIPDFSSKIHRFGSVRLGQVIFPVRHGSACAFRTRRGSVRFGSIRRVRFRPVPKLSGSVRFGRFGTVLIPSCFPVSGAAPSVSRGRGAAPPRSCRSTWDVAAFVGDKVVMLLTLSESYACRVPICAVAA